MKYLLIIFFTFANISFSATNNQKAPQFTLNSSNNKSLSLKDFSGKWVVLEWFNKGCPFVKKFYEVNKMQELQKQYTDKNIIWLSIISSAKGKQGHETPAEAIKTREKWQIKSSHTLLDIDGVVGKKYDAKTTPHIFIINPKQDLVYQGAIIESDSDSIEELYNSIDTKVNEVIHTKIPQAKGGTPTLDNLGLGDVSTNRRQQDKH